MTSDDDTVRDSSVFLRELMKGRMTCYTTASLLGMGENLETAKLTSSSASVETMMARGLPAGTQEAWASKGLGHAVTNRLHKEVTTGWRLSRRD
jgi:hypothetical protein